MTNKNSKTDVVKWVKSFALLTSCHGYNDLYSNNNHCGKVFWILAIVGANIMAVQQIVDSVINYNNSEVSISMKEVTVPSMGMPDLMICPGTGLDLDKMYQSGFSTNLINHMQWASKFLIPADRDSDTTRFRSAKELDEIMQHMEISRYSQIYKYLSYSCEDLLALHMKATLIPIKDSCRRATYQLLFDFIYCWRIPNQDQTFPGLAAGMTILLRSVQSHNTYSERESKGFVLGIIGKDSQVTPGTNTILVPLNSIMNIEIYEAKKKTLQRRQWPRNAERCWDRQLGQLPCEDECFAKVIQKKCNCIHVIYSNESTTTPECSPFDLCPLTVAKNLSELEVCILSCMPYCEKRIYRTSVSYTNLDWEPIRNNLDMSFNRTVKGYTFIRMGFPELQYITVEEQDSFTLTGLISNIGGQLGLWLGCSILSLVQLLAMIAFQRAYEEK